MTKKEANNIVINELIVKRDWALSGLDNELLDDFANILRDKVNLLTIPVVVGQIEQLCEGLHNTDFMGKCFKCGKQVFTRDDKA